ncbi:MAG TPA: hypothetical protein VEH86_05885 [Candidatus Acidoferrum sp.]|nr:hypothetical protein [Candidatus Acidoferrum sp.]
MTDEVARTSYQLAEEMKGIRNHLTKLRVTIILVSLVLASILIIYTIPRSHVVTPNRPPTIQDFWILNSTGGTNATWAGQINLFAFNVTDSNGLVKASLSTNTTGTTTSSSDALNGTATWANFTVSLPSDPSILQFQFWVWNSNSSINGTTGIRYLKVYSYNSTSGAWNTPFENLGSAIAALEAAQVVNGNWSQVDEYTQVVLSHATTSDLATMISNLDSANDWSDILRYSAICKKLNIEQRQAINDALGNFTMCGSLPNTEGTGGYTPVFSPEDKWALFGYWYANSSWAQSYNSSITAKWNITAAYDQFDSAVNYSVSTGPHFGLPLYIYPDGTGLTETNRYYDECASTIDCYLIFYAMLNVSDALNKAVYWWSYLCSTHWNSAYQFFQYTPTDVLYECEAGFFFKIVGLLKYYYPNLGNWSYVIEDICNRFLSKEWNSPQWLQPNGKSTFSVVHASGIEGGGNNQSRLENTLAAWQTLMGFYLQLDINYQLDLQNMLYGTIETQPAWELLLTPTAGLFNSTANLFSFSSFGGYGEFKNDANATAEAEELMVMMGIVPHNTTISFPLEELQYEYTYDIDPLIFRINLTSRTLTFSTKCGGTLTFQYGTSPITVNFAQAGVYDIEFSASWNMIYNSSYPRFEGSLPNNIIYFTFSPLHSTSDTITNSPEQFNPATRKRALARASRSKISAPVCIEY